MTLEGRVLAGRYAVREPLGRGGMAEVYLATDRVLDRPVAVKVLGGWLADDDAFVERFRREALAAARLSHPNLVAVYDAGADDGTRFIVMEHVPGETLAAALARGGAMPAPTAAAIAIDVANALEVAHAAGIVHRDVKPENVMLTADGRAKLTDLGIARGLDGESLTRTASILGTASYVSPEQARGEPVDHRSDLYSLGCVLYQMLTGRRPFEGDDPFAVAYLHVHERPTPPRELEPSVPVALEASVLRAMEKDPDARFPSAAVFAAALGPAASQASREPVTAPLAPVGATAPYPPVGPEPPPRHERLPERRGWVPVAVALVVLALLGGIAAALISGEEPTGSADDRSPTPSPSPSLTPSPSPSPSRSPSPSPSPSPTVAPPVDAVNEALAALQAVVTEALADGRITEDAAGEIDEHVDGALGTFAEGQTEEAIRELDDLESRIDELAEEDEVSNQTMQRLDRALQALAEAMFLAGPTGTGDEDD
jgi:eukaryotic-like serine/threonine-protein kinase